MPTQHHTRTPKPKAGSVVIVSATHQGPCVNRMVDARDALSLMARWTAGRCTSGTESVWIFERSEWVPLGALWGL